jgi:hypothetical protein
MSTRVDAWLASALEDADRRGLPELRPLLEGLARTTASLRAAEREYLQALEHETGHSAFGGPDE